MFQYRALRDIRAALCPNLPAMPDVTDLTTEWYEDLDIAVTEMAKRDHPNG